MDPTVEFFGKLKRLAVTLESETTKLQSAFDNRNNEVDDETTTRALGTYHELKCDVIDLKGQIQQQLTQQKAREDEVSCFIKACRVTEQRVSKNVHTLKEHWEKYGYQAPSETQRPTSAKSQESDAEDEPTDENESAGRKGKNQEEPGDEKPSSPTTAKPQPFADLLQTPQLSDFGLSEIHLKRALAGADWCAEVPPMPELNLPHPTLKTPAPPPMPVTPKCALRMDEDEPQTPQVHNFGISEHTMCLLNDFTMDLLQKNVEKPPRASLNVPEPPGNSIMETIQAKDNLESPQPPVFFTPGLKIKKTASRCSPPPPDDPDPESPVQLQKLPTTPEAPELQTPYLNHLVSSKKISRQPGTINMTHNPEYNPTPAHGQSTGSKRNWEYDASEMSGQDAEDKLMPEMPNLKSLLGNSLQSRNAKMLKKLSGPERVTSGFAVNHLELDGATQDFSFGTPRLRKDFQEPSTPEMPDLSSVTQDICKLVSQTLLKKTAMAVVHPNIRADRDRISPLPPAVSVSVVSDNEFQSLPSYLKQMSLYSLNQAILNINRFMAECPGEKTEFHMEELKRITDVGAMTPVYVLCLSELKRLTHVGGAKSTSVYKLTMHS